MKWPTVVGKNLKLLFRSRESAFTIIFGPLLIILLVSAAFIGGDERDIRVGTYAPEYTELADKMIGSLNEKGYEVSVFANKSACTDLIKTGEMHTCVIFPEDFRFKEAESNMVTFSVDYSRINLVYEIIDGLSTEFNLESSAISEGVTSNILDRVAVAQAEVEEQIENAAAIDATLQELGNELSAGKSSFAELEMNMSVVDLREIRGRVTGLSNIITEIKGDAILAIEEAIDILQSLESACDNCTEDDELTIDEGIIKLRNATDELILLAKEGPDIVIAVSSIIDQAARDIEKMQERFGTLVAASQTAEMHIAGAQQRLETASERLTTLRGKLQHASDALTGSLGFNASSVSSPITTQIEPVTSEDGNLAFTYPYVLMLVIMFLGMMLSSTLIVMDKTSTAAFRNFTTATRDEYYTVMSFISTFLVLLLQVIVILLLSYFFVSAPLFNNFGVSLIILIFAITLFSFLGMIIGYWAGTQEAAMITSLSLGSILLFVSNLVLPLEAMNRVVQNLSVYNPYVVLSEMLKQSMLFDLKLRHIPGKLGLLVAAIFVLFFFIIIVQRSFKARYFQRRSKDLAASQFSPTSVRPLKLGEREVHDLFELLEVLDNMTRATFGELITPQKNPIANWVRHELDAKSLARKLKTTSKEQMIIILEKHVKKLTKKLAKQR